MSSNVELPGKVGLVNIDGGDPPPASVISLHNNLLKSLNRAYPAWVGTWSLRIDTDGGILQVRNMMLSGKMGFVMKLQTLDFNVVNRLAGELFERYGVAREKAVDIIEQQQLLKRKPTGEAIYDE